MALRINYNISLESSKSVKFSDRVLEKINTHFVFSHLFSENRVACEIMWKNVVEPDWQQV
jgi:hypothetical protein